MVLFNYYYFAKPDYEDVTQKAWYAGKIGFALGTTYTAYYLALRPMFPQTAEYVGYHWSRKTVPLTSSMVLGSMCTSMIARARGNKDDLYNIFYGFLPTGIIWSALFKNTGYGATAGLALAVAAVVAKWHHTDNQFFEQSLPLGRFEDSGTFGGMNGGDRRWMYPEAWLVPDPGRYPPL